MYVVQGSEMGRMEGWEGMSMQLWSLANFSKVESVPATLSITVKKGFTLKSLTVDINALSSPAACALSNSPWAKPPIPPFCNLSFTVPEIVRPLPLPSANLEL